MKFVYPKLNILDQGEMAGITRKSSAAVFPLWSLKDQNGCVNSRENNINNFTQISIAYYRFNLR